MGSLHERNVSLWIATTPESTYPPLPGDQAIDVAIIGAGITGLTTAALLKRAGARVAVIEAGHVASGVTGYTTAKITSLHTLVYARLVGDLGPERARIYADSNEAAISLIADIVRDLAIDCDFRRMPAITYTEDPGRVRDIQAEVEASRSLGLPASYTETADLPYPIRAAVRFDNQALFHPRKYCLGLARFVDGDGCHVYEQTRATGVEEGAPCVVTTDRGAVRAEQVVVATQIPFLDRGGYFAKTSPSRSYVIGVRAGAAAPQGMYINVESPTRSVRPHPLGDETVLLIGGEGHKVGHDEDTRRRYAALEAWARERFDVRSIDYRWSAQDYEPADGVPYIGRLTGGSERVFVATGYRKWGMTTGTVAAMILWELILGRDHPWASLYDSTRLDLTRSAKELIAANADVAQRYFGDRLAQIAAPPIDQLGLGEGKIVDAGGEKVAAYRDETGAIHAVSPICAHLGCLVAWNSAETTWDCPCHGSRYTIDGRAIQGPTTKDLDPKL